MKRFLTAICLLQFVACFSAGAYKLELNLEKGKTYPINMSLTSHFKQTISGKPVDFDMDISIASDFKIIDIQDSIYKTVFTFNDFLMKVKIMNITTEMKPGSPDIASQAFSLIIGKHITCDLSKTGKISNTSGLKELIEEIIESKNSVIPEGQKEQLRAQLEQSFGEGTLNGNMLLDNCIYPGHDVNIGDEWSGEKQTSNVVPFVSNVKYKLIAVTDSYYLVTYKSDFSASGINGNSDTPNTAKVSGKGHATIKLDRNTGWIDNSKANMVLSGEFEVPNGSTQINVPSKIDMKITINGQVKKNK